MSNPYTNLALIVFLFSLSQPAPGATAADRIEELIQQGQLDKALDLTEDSLAADRGNVNYLFLKGLILTRLGRLEEAKGIFISLTEDHPELPEPFNNLAVIYAEQGDFNNAREALQKAINTHPSYATAHENLGDIYAKMASRAYNQALELDEDNASAREKLLLVSDLFSTRSEEHAAAASAATQESDRLNAELSRLEQARKTAEGQAAQELTKVNQARRELAELQAEHARLMESMQANRVQAEKEAQLAAEQAQVARAELDRLEQQAGRTGEQVRTDQKNAAAETARLRGEIAALTSEMSKVKEDRDRAVQQAEAERARVEDQVRAARDAAAQARAELAALEQKQQASQANLARETAALEQAVNQSRRQAEELRLEISRLEQQRARIVAQLEQDRQAVDKAGAEPASLRNAQAALEPGETGQSTQSSAIASTAPAGGAGAPPGGEPDPVEAIHQWAERWSAQDVEGYLAAYAESFKPADGGTRSAWAAQRRERIRKPDFIRVGIDNIRIKLLGAGRAEATFKQSYQSESYRDYVDKTLSLQLWNGRWLITAESTN
jgi:hypothetical protein